MSDENPQMRFLVSPIVHELLKGLFFDCFLSEVLLHVFRSSRKENFHQTFPDEWKIRINHLSD